MFARNVFYIIVFQFVSYDLGFGRNLVLNDEGTQVVERVALISDTHIAGPEYHVNTESNTLDNDSIVRSQMRMYVAARQIQALQGVDPPPKLLAMIGDVVHNGLHILDEFGVDQTGLEQLFGMDVNGYTIGADILGSIDLPKLYVWGEP
jgi:hypothetical protein